MKRKAKSNTDEITVRFSERLAKQRMRKLERAQKWIKQALPVFSNGYAYAPSYVFSKLSEADQAVRKARTVGYKHIDDLNTIISEQRNIIRAIKTGKPLEGHDYDDY